MSGPGTGAPTAGHLCFFGTYPKEYTVSRLLRSAALAAGFTVTDVHEPLWEETRTKTTGYFRAASVARLGLRYGRAVWRLRRKLASVQAIDAYVTGFQGQLDTLALGRLRDRGVPIIFAPLVTLTETLIEDRRIHDEASLIGYALRRLDYISLHAADHVVIDTEAHRRYVIERFEVDPQRISTWHLGADSAAFSPLPPRPDDGRVRVLFFGSFLPLHGIQTILEAMRRLDQRRDIDFVMLGEGPELVESVGRAAPSNITWLPWVPYAELPRHVAMADICLGCFGPGPKAAMVIPNKVYQAASMGCAVISADTAAIREVFTDGENISLCPAGDAAALAGAIQRLVDDSALRQRLGGGADKLMRHRFSAAARGEGLRALIEQVRRK